MAEYSEDELHPPTWLSKEFFLNVLVNCENDKSVKIKDLTISPGSIKGDHFASTMFRALVHYECAKSKESSKSMIIKIMTEMEGPKKEMLENLSLFETEIAVYANSIPAFEAELRKIGDDTLLGIRILYTSLGEKKCVVLEDISPEGYVSIKCRMANLEESKAALLKLAKWHAVSYKLAAEGDESIKNYRENLLNMKGIEEIPYLTNGIHNFISMVQKHDELKKYTPKLQALAKDLLQNCIDSYNSYFLPKKNEAIYALCHGDFHVKNLMVKLDDNGGLEDLVLLDFQNCNYGPAVLDLKYAIYMLFSEEVRRNHCEELVYYYCSNFIETLKRLNFQGSIPSVTDFYVDILRFKHWELYLITTFLPMWYVLLDGKVDAEELMESDELREKMYEDPDYIKEVKRVLPILHDRGYLD